MKKLILSLVLSISFTTLFAQQYQLNIGQSQLHWKGYGEVGGFSQEGSITPKRGQIQMEEEELKNASLVIDMKSIKNEDKSLTKHLKNKDFFYVKKYPEANLEMITFCDGMMQANLTIRGITKAIECPVEIMASKGKVKVKGKVTIDRTQFDIKYNSSSYFQDLGNYAIKNDFDLSFELYFER
ncbi:MAG: YceI family protein [Bacteroidota bacterium]